MSDTAMPATQASATSRRTPRRIGTIALWAGGFALIALNLVLAFKRGGSQPDDVLWGAVPAFAVLGALALAAPWPLIRSRSGLVALAGLVGLAAWTALSVGWARIQIHAANDAARVALYAAFFAAALIAMRSPLVRRATPLALLGAIAIAAVYGLGTRVLPDLFDAEVFGSAGARLHHPITYWNGLGILTGAGMLTGVAVAAERASLARPLRALACALVVPCGVACYLTVSRGAFVAVFAGFAVLALARPRVGTLATAVCALAPVGALIVVLQALPEVRAVPDNPPVQTAQGVVAAAAIVLGTVLAGVAFALLAPRIDGMRRAWRPTFRTAAGLAVAATAVVLVATVAVSYASEQSEELPTSTSRVTEARTYRGPYWEVALGAFADHPLTGVGSGSFRVEWLREANVRRGAVDAHSLYFETLGELGIVGGALLAVLLGAIGAGAVRTARVLPRDPVLPAAAAVLAAYAVHFGVDWDWELPAVTMPFLLMAAAAVTRPEPDIDSSA